MDAILRRIAQGGNIVFENLRLGEPDFKPARFPDVDLELRKGVFEMEEHKSDEYVIDKIHENRLFKSHLGDWLKR